VVREKVRYFLLNMCFAIQIISCNNIPKCVVGYYTLTPIGASKQMGT